MPKNIHNKLITVLLILSSWSAFSVQAENQKKSASMFSNGQLEHYFRHSLFLSVSTDLSPQITGQHLAGTNPPILVAAQNATIDGSADGIKSVGYNMKYIPDLDLGLGLEFGVYYSNTYVPRQLATLRGDNGAILVHPLTRGPLIVNSPSSYIQTADFYMGAWYSFPEITSFNSQALNLGFTPYVGAGYTRVLGKWRRSFFNPSNPNDRYGQISSTDIDGYYVSGKIGAHFLQHCSVEFEYAQHFLQADSFRSFNINGSDIEYDRFSFNLLFNF